MENVLTAHIIVSSVRGKASTRVQPTELTDLAVKWGIGLEELRRTLECKTQRGLQTVLHPYLSRCFRTNDRKSRYRQLRHDVFCDTLIAGTKSKRGNKHAEAFITKFGWLLAFTMARTGDVHEALSLLFQRNGVPPKMIVDVLKEKTLGVFKLKVAEADCHLR